MSKGYVYILTNEHMPGLVKIGRTTRDVGQRANELFQTGVPSPFIVADAKLSPDCELLEIQMHEHFWDSRVGDNREFFKVDAEEACLQLWRLLYFQVNDWLVEFLNDCVLMPKDMIFKAEHLNALEAHFGEKGSKIISALNAVTAEELKPALDRVNGGGDTPPPSLSVVAS